MVESGTLLRCYTGNCIEGSNPSLSAIFIKIKNKMSKKTLFQKIIDREIPSEIIYEDDICIAINDINPQAPIHILLIPKKPITKLSNCTDNDKDILGHLLLIIKKITYDLKINESFRVNINNGEDAGQEVFHLHIHILAGRKFSWPPG